MKKDSKTRLFEVMGRLDKSFKPKLNEDLEDIIGTEVEDNVVAEPEAEEPKELTADEKLAALTAKIDSLYAMVHGDESGEESAEAEEEKIEGEPEGEEKEENEIEFQEAKKIPVADIAKVGK